MLEGNGVQMEEFLEGKGYKCWKKDFDECSKTEHYQRRVDNLPGYRDNYPLCRCNNKLFIDIIHYRYTIHGTPHNSLTAGICHENAAGEWCDLKIYSLSGAKVKESLDSIEQKLLNMWKAFNG